MSTPATAPGASDTAATPPSTATTAPASASGAVAPTAMPAFTAPLLDGQTFDIAARRGTVVLLNLWATWCGPCVYEIPELQKIHDTYKAKGFEVVGVSVDEGGADQVKTFAAEHKIAYPVALDPEGKLATIFDASVLPTSVLVDRGGRIVWKKVGAVMPGDEDLTKAVEAALAAK